MTHKSKYMMAFAILIGVIFASGFFAGIIADRNLLFRTESRSSSIDGNLDKEKLKREIMNEFIESSPKEKGGLVRDFFIAKLDSELDLNSQQEKNIKRILMDNEDEFRILRKQVRKDMFVFRSKVEDEISGELDQKQKAVFRKLLKKLP